MAARGCRGGQEGLSSLARWAVAVGTMGCRGGQEGLLILARIPFNTTEEKG